MMNRTMFSARWLIPSFALASMFLALSAVGAAQQQRRTTEPPPQLRPEVLHIDWAAARQAEQTQAPTSERARQFIVLNRAAIDQLRLPVLIPRDPDLASALRLVVHRDGYTVSAKLPELAFTLTGSHQAFRLPPNAVRRLPPGGLKSRLPANGILVEVTDSGVDVSQTRFGVNYSMSLECANGTRDRRCADASYVRGLISRLTVVVPANGE
jgi:hypothetical protein